MGHVKIWVRDGFHCVYCNAYLLADRIRLHSAQFDHLLPKAKYERFEQDQDNLVLACCCCNQLKGTCDPNLITYDGEDMEKDYDPHKESFFDLEIYNGKHLKAVK